VGGFVARGVGAGVEVGGFVGAGVGFGVGLGVGFGVGFGVGVGAGVGFGVGVGGTLIVTEPAASVSSNRSRLIASNTIVCVPAGSLPDQVNVVRRFQSSPLLCSIACAVPSTLTRTQSAGDPSRFR
jgi:hypothetical protein